MGLDKQIGERDPYIMASQTGVSAPRAGVRCKSGGVTLVSGSNKKIEIRCPATFVADLNFDQKRWECQSSTRIDGGVSGQNKVGNPVLHRCCFGTVSFWSCHAFLQYKLSSNTSELNYFICSHFHVVFVFTVFFISPL